MKYSSMVVHIMVLSSLAGSAHAAARGIRITYEGKGAGEVVFDGTVHAAKGLTCADCHEGHELTPALFEMKRGVNGITMRKMELGRSCGQCHNVSSILKCEKCHHK